MSWPVVPATGWRLPDDACALLARLVDEHRPRLIVECGSGRSTVVLAAAAAEYGGRVVALEHDPGYSRETRGLLSLLPGVEVRDAPLEPHGEDLPVAVWYSRAAWDDLYEIGMLIVDGPPGHKGTMARLPAVPLLRDRLLPGCVVLLDDVDRTDEQAMIDLWGMDATSFVHEQATLAYGTVDG